MTKRATTTEVAPPRGVLHGRLKGLLGKLLRAIDRARQRRTLAELDVRLLRDIGRSREEARREAGKWL